LKFKWLEKEDCISFGLFGGYVVLLSWVSNNIPEKEGAIIGVVGLVLVALLQRAISPPKTRPKEES